MTDKKIKVAVNGFGRIGRIFFKLALQNRRMEIVAINDLGDIENMAYLLRYDTAQKDLNLEVSTKIISDDEKYLIVGGKEIPFYSIPEPENLPWQSLEVDIVAECTGVFNSFHKAERHLRAGAKKVVLSGPTKDGQNTFFDKEKKGSTVLMGLNDSELEFLTISSNGSCTTNATVLPLKILDEKIGVESAMLTTIHSYTATQSIVDAPVRKKKDFRRGRAGAMNLIPTTTGSEKAVPKVYQRLESHFAASAVRVPTISGSIADLTVLLKEERSVKEINELFLQAEKEYPEYLKCTKEPLVSTDIIGETFVAIVDLSFTKTTGRMLKLFVWYDNESGYAYSFLKHILKAGESL